MKIKKLHWHSDFKRAFSNLVNTNPNLQQKILDTLDLLSKDPFNPKLKTHRLHGKLSGLYACIIEYNCRLIFLIEKEPDDESISIGSVNIGSPDEIIRM